MTIKAFIESNKLSMSAVRIARRTDRFNQTKEDKKWDATASHWHVTFTNSVGDVESWEYSMGSACKGEPTTSDVLESLRMDASGRDGMSFEDWCSEYGLDTDSKRAEATYNACGQTAYKLRSLLGRDAYAQLHAIEV